MRGISTSWPRRLRWATFLGVLTLLGVGIYHVQPPEPLWTAKLRKLDGVNRGSGFPIQFCAGGKQFFTQDAVFEDSSTPKPDQEFVQVWDVATRTMRGRFPKSGVMGDGLSLSKDCRYLVACCTPVGKDKHLDKENFLCLVDLVAGGERILPLPMDDRPNGIHFSPRGDILAVIMSAKSLMRIYETSTGKLVDELASDGSLAESAFFGDYVVHVNRSGEHKPGERPVECWSLRDRKVVGAAKYTGVPYFVSADGQFLVAQQNADDGGPDGTWKAWNLRSHAEPTVARPKSFLPYLISLNGDGFVLRGIRESKAVLEFASLPSGQIVDSLVLDEEHDGVTFSPDGRFFATFTRPVAAGGVQTDADAGGLRVYATATRQKLWAPVAFPLEGRPRFTPDSKRIITAPQFRPRIDIFDATAQFSRVSIKLPRHGFARADFAGRHSGSDLPITPDSRMLLVHQPHNQHAAIPETIVQRLLSKLGIDPAKVLPEFNDYTIVFALDSNRERFRLQSWNASQPLLSDDGNTLVTLHVDVDQTVMRCWEVHAWKPMRWAFGVPAALGVLLLLLGMAKRRWRPRRPVSSQPPTPT